jgi:hypothetical protein
VSRLSQPFRNPRTGIFYFRRVIPKPFRAILGKWEWKRSLGTKSFAEAKARYLQAAHQYESALDAVRTGQPTTRLEPFTLRAAVPSPAFLAGPAHTLG